MPAQRAWIHRIGEIAADLDALSVPVLDRAAIEQLFRISRRGAVDLMNRFGAYQAGKSLVIDRAALLAALLDLEGTDAAQQESGRRQRIGDALEALRTHRAAAQVKIPVAPDVFSVTMSALSPDVEIEPGALHIRYANGIDLVRKLFELSQAIANDFDRFEQLTRAPEELLHSPAPINASS